MCVIIFEPKLCDHNASTLQMDGQTDRQTDDLPRQHSGALSVASHSKKICPDIFQEIVLIMSGMHEHMHRLMNSVETEHLQPY